MTKTSISGLRRIAALGLGLAMVGGLSLVAATPASAVPPTTYSLNGTVLTADGPLADADVTLRDTTSAVVTAGSTDDAGAFTLVELADGDYTLDVGAAGYVADTVEVTVAGQDMTLDPITLVAEETDAPEWDDPDTFSISGTVTAKDGNAAFAPSVKLDGVTGSSPELGEVDESGNFTFSNVAPDADLTLEFSADGYQTVVKDIAVSDSDVVDVAVELVPNLPALAGGTVKISGDPVVGNVLKATTSGWPAGTTLSYQWGYSGGQFGGPIDGATKSTYTVASDQLGMMLSVFVTGTKAGFAPTTQSQFMTTAVTAAKKPAAEAPAGDTGGLAVYLKGRGVTAQSQTAAGLPAGDLDPGEDYTATLDWSASDSYVDVYLYSTPTLVGTFPVVNGSAKITLSAEVLSELEAGNHTLVVTGQTSGAVQAVALTVADVLASTGFSAGGPLAIAVLLLLLGAALLVVRRRRLHA